MWLLIKTRNRIQRDIYKNKKTEEQKKEKKSSTGIQNKKVQWELVLVEMTNIDVSTL